MSVSLPQVSNEAHVGTNLGLFLKKKKSPQSRAKSPHSGCSHVQNILPASEGRRVSWRRSRRAGRVGRTCLTGLEADK